MVPHNVILVHLIAGIVGKSVCIQLGQVNLVFLLKMPHFALGKKEPFPKIGQPEGGSVTDDGLSLLLGK
jgi:hypothetical protein